MSSNLGAFDWNQIRAFLATVETGSLSAAARSLGLTQPTLSRQVAALERDLGVMLFERLGRALVLTSAGAELAGSVRDMGEAARRVSLAASSQSQSISGLVRISASDVVATYLLPNALKRLHEIAPSIQIDVVAANTVSDLMRREADIAIRHLRPTQPDLVARRCPDTTARLYAATSWLDRHGRPATGADLAGAALIGYTETGDLVAELNARGLPVTASSFTWTSGSVVVAWEMIRQGLGPGVMFSLVADADPSVEPVLPGIAPFPVPMWLATHRELHTSRRIRLVFDFLADMLMGAIGRD
ncbi:LysR family transcriptional regulator [Devosia sp. SL43]|uniref:LysR family transcriptional regulator n=1 Tax=Devosia sp. SL43 TaxID=2806348 RepID=UPI001F271F69|nr:LysR family transcriptional regulator [Devosia sp. SL43]UJW86973.1 LysR family transcriptional regulator [Devosia sp. SL43]